jgi:MinD superfamily P-loop ATPase
MDFPQRRCGQWFVSDTRCGPMVHARLGVAAENSGKLVSTVRTEARHLADEENRKIVIVDGPPGIGCPVIASVTGASQVLIVTEPTVSGEHDLERVLALARHFRIPTAICVNKWDINEEMTRQIETKARNAGASVAGRIRYDSSVTRAQIQKKAVVELDTPGADDMKQLWKNLSLLEGMK